MQTARRVVTLSCGAAAALLALCVAAPAQAQCTGFSLTQTSGAAIAPGTTDIGNHGDDLVTSVPLPFPVTFYGVPYSTGTVSSNGNIQFTTGSSAYTNSCLPASALGIGIAAYWDDLRTDAVGDGIFTSISGVAPNRVFNIEYRAHYYSGGGVANFEVRLFEDQTGFEIIYGTMAGGGTSATVGVQHTTYPPTQPICNSGGVTAGMRLRFTCSNDPIPPTGSGFASPTAVYACGTGGGATLLSVLVTPGFGPTSTGIGVTTNLTSIGGSASQTFYDDGSHGDAAAGDNRFSFGASVASTITPGNKSLSFTVSDAQGRSSNGVFGVTVNPCPSNGPDVFVARLTDIGYYGAVSGISAYAVGTDACNAGDVPVNWYSTINEHPVIAQNMYRLSGGRFEQIGQSWLKHGFSSTNSATCGACTSPPGGGQQLGVNCSDAYGSGLNGSQGNLGPRSQVNATTGAYPYPWSAPAAPATIGRRLQVFTSDIDPALNAGAIYIAEAHYVTADDARWSNGVSPATNGLNNASYQRILIPTVTATPSLTSVINRMSPGIKAWKDLDPTVQLAPADYVDTSLSATGIVARFWVASKVTDNGNGTWHYEFAVQNLNSDRCGGSFSVPMGAGVVVTNIGFHGSFAHSGEPYPNTAANPNAWAGVASAGAVTWTAPQAYVAPGDSANALRWGTMYNFRFDANVAPTTGAATIGLFKPGTGGDAVTAVSLVAGSSCGPADFDGDGDNGTDLDIEAFFACLGGNCCGTCWTADFDGDGDTGTDLDIETFFRITAGGEC